MARRDVLVGSLVGFMDRARAESWDTLGLCSFESTRRRWVEQRGWDPARIRVVEADEALDAALDQLSGCHSLRRLAMFRLKLDHRHVRRLAGLPGLELRELNLIFCNVGDEGVGYLARIPTLEVLDLTDNELSDCAGLALAKLSRLRELNIAMSTTGANTGDALIEQLAPLQSLTTLRMGAACLSEDGAVAHPDR